MSNDAESTPTASRTPEHSGDGGNGQSGGRHSDLEAALEVVRNRRTDSAEPIDVLRTHALQVHAQRWKTIPKLKLKSVTPIYGGGSAPGQVDWLVPLRPRAIKNAIRHWWWLLNRHQYAGQAKKLYEDMVAIWGGPSEDENDRSARVRVIVSLPLPQELEKHRFTYLPYKESRSGTVTQNPDDPWLYALFGAKGKLRPNRPWNSFNAFRELINDGPATGNWRLKRGQDFDEPPADLLAPGLTLELRIFTRDLAPAQCDQIKDAFAFWLAFGGVGARTSRGLGRLSPIEDKFLQATWARVQQVVQRQGTDFSLVAPTTALRFGSPEQALRALLNAYREVRQSRETPRGYTHWPKAEIVRRITGADLVHLRRNGSSDFLPELMFGAPIVVDFQNRGPATTLSFASKIDNETIELQRYPSPLLFGAKPSGSAWEPVVLVIEPTPDFKGRTIHAQLKWKEYNAERSHLLAPGAWWPDFDGPNYENDLRTSTRALRVPGATTTDKPFNLFLDKVRRLSL